MFDHNPKLIPRELGRDVGGGGASPAERQAASDGQHQKMLQMHINHHSRRSRAAEQQCSSAAVPLSLMTAASEGAANRRASGSSVGGVGWETGLPVSVSGMLLRIPPLPPPPPPPPQILPYAGSLQPLYSKSRNCIIFQGPCFCLAARPAPLIKLMEK